MSRRPIVDSERPYLLALGRLLATTRRAVGLTQQQVALEAGLHWTSVQRVELGQRRTRRSTLQRIAAVFVLQEPRVGPVDVLLDDLVRTAGPALAPESEYADRVARRRAAREERDWQQSLERRRRQLVESLLRFEECEYGRLMSEWERQERWDQAQEWLQEAARDVAERRQNLGDLRG